MNCLIFILLVLMTQLLELRRTTHGPHANVNLTGQILLIRKRASGFANNTLFLYSLAQCRKLSSKP